jgi:hypothetical protein
MVNGQCKNNCTGKEVLLTLDVIKTPFLMKKLSLISIFMLLFYFSAEAQKYGKELYKPIAGAKGITIAFQAPNPITLSGPDKLKALVFLRYMITDQWSLRVGASYKRNRFKYQGLLYDGGTIEKFAGDTTGFEFRLGIQRSFGYNAKLDPYMGVELLLGIGRSKYRDVYTVQDASLTPDPNDSNGDFQKIIGKNTPINKYGIMPFAGFNYFIVENFAIGGELGWGIVRINYGHLKETISDQTGSVDTSTRDKSSNTITGNGVFRVNVSAFF